MVKSQLQEAADECRLRQQSLEEAKQNHKNASDLVQKATEAVNLAQQNLEDAYRTLQEAQTELNYHNQKVETSIVTMRSYLNKASPYASIGYGMIENTKQCDTNVF